MAVDATRPPAPIGTHLVAYHLENGPVMMAAIDAGTAAASHPREWSLTPWTPQQAERARMAGLVPDVDAPAIPLIEPVRVTTPTPLLPEPGPDRIETALGIRRSKNS